jgi:ribosomal protein S8
MIKKKIKEILYVLQIIIFYFSYYFYKFLLIKSNKTDWVIGVSEIANNIYFLGNILENSITVCLDKNSYYKSNYTYEINVNNKLLKYIVRFLYGPILFGKLIHISDRFFYIWSTGFLFNREFEFKFLKQKEKKIICLFCGNDIRSPKKTLEYFQKQNSDTFIEYFAFCNPKYLSDEYEKDKKEVAKIADKYADVIFNHKLDQLSYLKSEQYDLLIPYDENKFNKHIEKFENVKKIKIVHAPSFPIIKGTSLVRAAIKQLKEEGYIFEYIELKNMPNKVVLEHLKTAHILLNQFYSVATGLLGIEGMANYCAVMMRAYYYFDYEQEPWVQTEYYEIYDKLKYLLDNPKKIQQYAEAGYNFVRKYHSYAAIKKYLFNIFYKNGIVND